MVEIKHTEVADWLRKQKPDALPPVYLIHGEPFVARKIYAHLLDALVPEKDRSLCYDFLEGDDARVPEMVARLSTYSMMQDRLVVAAKDVPLFFADGGPGVSVDDQEKLKTLMEKGFPLGHHLLLTIAKPDRRRALFKAFGTHGLVVDCAVAQGIRKADKVEQAALMRTLMESVLAPRKKGIDGQAFSLLTDQVGFDPSTLVDNLEKLADFIGDRPGITAADVTAVVERTRKDAIFEFTNAVADRKVAPALFYFRSMVHDGLHPLQFLKSLINQMRKITRVKAFVAAGRRRGQGVWQPGQSYQQFTRATLPAVVKADEAMMVHLEKWEDYKAPAEDPADEAQADDLGASLDIPGSGGRAGKIRTAAAAPGKGKKRAPKKAGGGKGKKGSAGHKGPVTDLAMAPNPKNAYPIYQTFLKSDNFTETELIRIIMDLADLDYRLKSGIDHPLIHLENFIISICNQ